MPSIAIAPKSIVNLKTIEITTTISTRNQAAVVWTKDGTRHLGLLDFKEALIRQLKPSVRDDRLSAEIEWSPDGTVFTYEQARFGDGKSASAGYLDSDVFAVPVNNSGEIYILLSGMNYFGGCEWRSDGRSVACYYALGHGMSCEARTFDSTTWRQTSGGFSSCPWDQKTQATEETNAIISEYCQRYQMTCYGNASPDRRFVALNMGYDTDTIVLDTEERRSWRVGNAPYTSGASLPSWSWPADSRYLAWAEQDQIRVFDTTTHTITAYVVPGAKMLNVAWSPLQ